jgi:hypothetical protein
MPGKRLVQMEKTSATREAQWLIGQKLSEYYDLGLPMPDRLTELLKQLAQPIDNSEGETSKFGLER